jgi:hypothetical protein
VNPFRSIGHGVGRVGRVVIRPVQRPVRWAVQQTQKGVRMAIVSRVVRYLAVAVAGAMVGAGYVSDGAESQELVGALVTVAMIAARVVYAEKVSK